MILRYIFLIAICCNTVIAYSQQNDAAASGRISPKEFAIPASPVFDLMGVTPSLINRTSDIKDFKVDWSFKSWKLNPNLAIQSQPVWELFYNHKDLSRYQASSGFKRKLASLDVSLGTVQNEDNDRRIGFATKMNVIKRKDPLMAKNLYEDIGQRYKEERESLQLQLKELQLKLDTTANILDKPSLRTQLKTIEDQLASLNSKRNTEINDRAKIFIAENWNAASLDVAFGRVFTYQTDSAGSLKKLRLNRNTGWGIWLNGGFPLGKKILVSGLLRTTWYEEQLDFLVKNNTTGDETTTTALAGNKIYSGGLNVRYGGLLYSFFAEFLFERKAVQTPADALSKVFTEPSGFSLVQSSVKWTVLHPYNLSIGGDWRVGKNVIINYGLRWILNSSGKTDAFIPVAGISCMMR